MANERILIVDDEESMRFFLEEALSKEGYQVQVAKDGDLAVKRAMDTPFDAIIMDVKMPKLGGIEALEEIRKRDQEVEIIMLTAYGSEKVAVEAIRKGAYDYFTKPFDIDEMRAVVRRAIERRRLAKENRLLKMELERKCEFKNILGESGRMMEVFEQVSQVVNTSVTILIYGESGTGKELIARAIHYNGPRRDKPFVEMNCVAIPETLLESELFGHEKGAFTGAVSRKLGKFELAHEGTLFLDEVGDMNLLTQAKFLRVLQEREFDRVGGTMSIKVDVRIIAATNKDLAQAIKNKEFREDLYYRLNVVNIFLPPLREKREDIPLLVEHFMKQFNKQFNKDVKHISMEAMELLMKYPWPGNVRELENVLQRAIVLEKGDTLTKEHLPLMIQALDREVKLDLDRVGVSKSLSEAVEDVVADVERQFILKALKKTNWNRTRAAEELKISRKSLHNKMNKYGLMKAK